MIRSRPDLAWIFDMDGVIVDSNPAHRRAWEAFNRRYGLETTEAMYRFMYGRRNDEIVRGFFGDGLPAAEVAARGAAKERLYREMIAGKVDGMMPAGLRGFLEARRGAPMALASNAEPENIAFILKESGLAKYFRVVVDGHQVERPKPFPDIYRRAAELLGEPPANCIVFEDSYSGVEAARAAGMRVVGLRTTHKELPGADIAIDDFRSEELEAWLGAQ
ncbi:MAG: HAD family phosphatase [Bryobacteraceae bacterium]